MTIALHGVCASKGIAMGQVAIVERGLLTITEGYLSADQVSAEVVRFEHAVAGASEELKTVRAAIPEDAPDDVAAFINVHLLMLEDPSFLEAAKNHIRERLCTAEWALKLELDSVMAVFEAMDDDYLRTRIDDVHHVVRMVQRWLQRPPEDGDGPCPGVASATDASGGDSLTGRIVFSEDLTPADTVLLQNRGITGFLTAFGGATSHTAILARGLRIPAVVGLHGARGLLREGDFVIVDGRDGVVLVDPDDRTQRHYRHRLRDIQKVRTDRRKLRGEAALTGDGERISLQANVELLTDVEVAAENGADGVGLYRTESLFMNRSSPPDEEEQFDTYARVIEAMRGRPVTIRTVDLGADKQVDGVRPGAPASSNPALGLRAVRLCLRDANWFAVQLRAILRASALGPVRMMIPMLTNTLELEQVSALLDENRAQLKAQGVAFDAHMPVGGMIEVPAAALCADIFARYLDFLSIGTNDLIQYTVAVDRVDDEVNYLYDPLHPAVLRLIDMTIRAGQRGGIPVSMCGEMAGDARFTRLLLGLGLREFSVHPNALLEIKQIIKESNTVQLRGHTKRLMRAIKTQSRTALLDSMNSALH